MKYRWTMILHCTEKIIGLSKDVSLPIVIFLVVTVTWQGLQHIQRLTFEIEAKFFHKQRADVGGFRRVNWWHARSSLLQKCYALLELDRSRPVIRAFFLLFVFFLLFFSTFWKSFIIKSGGPCACIIKWLWPSSLQLLSIQSSTCEGFPESPSNFVCFFRCWLWVFFFEHRKECGF